MALLKIARMGHPVLHSPADPVEDPTDPAVARLFADMVETLADSGGVGLAAPQVHVPLRAIIFFVPGGRAETAEEEQGLTLLLNPVIEPLSEQMAEMAEACLSVPGLSGPVPRWTHIRYSGLDLQGRLIEREAKGFHARVVQHEVDHLNGIVYPQRIRDFSQFGFVDELRRAASQNE